MKFTGEQGVEIPKEHFQILKIILAGNKFEKSTDSENSLNKIAFFSKQQSSTATTVRKPNQPVFSSLGA